MEDALAAAPDLHPFNILRLSDPLVLLVLLVLPPMPMLLFDEEVLEFVISSLCVLHSLFVSKKFIIIKFSDSLPFKSKFSPELTELKMARKQAFDVCSLSGLPKNIGLKVNPGKLSHIQAPRRAP